MRNPGYVAQGTDHVLWLRLTAYNLHKGAKHLESLFSTM